MTGVTDLEGICVDIGCTAAQPISACEQSLHTDPNGWIERLERQEKGSGPDRHTLREIAGVAVLRRSAYPMAEF